MRRHVTHGELLHLPDGLAWLLEVPGPVPALRAAAVLDELPADVVRPKPAMDEITKQMPDRLS
jgi:hypothetical protein